MSITGHILIVDDLEPNREALGRMLQKEGLTVEDAVNGAQALEKLRQGAFDAVLLDVMMPVMDGIETLTRLKADPATVNLPVIMLSAMHEAESVRKCIELGADDFLPKPIDRLLLRARLTACLRRKMYQDQAADYLTRLEASNLELRRLGQLKSRFLAIAAHDLKNPMTSILILTDQLCSNSEEGLPASIQRKVGQRINDSVQKMLGIVQALLDSAAFEAGHLVLKKKPTDLEQLTRAVVEANVEYGRSKAILLECLAPPPGHLVALVDDTRIREAFDNLVNNAIKFSPAQTRIEVGLALKEDGDGRRADFSVRDQGPGLTEEDKQKAFGYYQQLSAQPTGNEVSTGLGLSIVKQMVELHDGCVWVESEAGRGSTFHIELPLLEPGYSG